MPSPRKERERVKPPATDDQAAYIVWLHKKGYLLDEEMPHNFHALDIQQAHEILNVGEARLRGDSPWPEKGGERPGPAKPSATDAQIAYIGRLHERGHLLDEEVPRDLRALDVQQAHEVISKGEVRAIKERAKSDPVRLRDEGARARAASAALDRERGAKAHEKLIDRMQPAR